MSNPPFPHDPQNPSGYQAGGEAWEQSQPTGNVWAQQPTDSYGGQPGNSYDQQPPQYGGAPYGYAPAPSQVGFFAALFDFSFSSYVTNKVIKFVYILATVIIGIMMVALIIAAFATKNALSIIGAIILVPISSILYLALMRMSLEVTHAIIRISEDVHERLPRA